jgi:hypothetical protein
MDLHVSTFFSLFLILFFHSHASFARMMEEDHAKNHRVFIWWKWKGMFLLTSSVEVYHIFGGVYVILILGA